MFVLRSSLTRKPLHNPSPALTRPSALLLPSQIRMMSSPAAKIKSLDHLVLTVASIESTKAWYQKNLGMKPESFISAATPGVTRHSLIFGSQKINLHQLGKEFEPKALRVKDGSADICFLTDDDVKVVRKQLISTGVEMVDLGSEPSDGGIVKRTGAQGELRSVYCRDPDGNLIEISNYV